MGQLEDLFIQNFDVTSDTLVDKSSGQPINAWKFGDGTSKPFLETPEFVGYVDSAIYHLTDEFSEVCMCEYDSDSIEGVLDALLESQISKRVTEVFNEEVAVEMVDHMFKYAQEIHAKTELLQREAARILQPLMHANGISSMGLHLVFHDGANYGLEEDDPIIPAIHFSYGYQQGWDAFKEMYNNVKVLDHKGFAKTIVETYFLEPERAMPFTFPDLAARISELETVET